jgi:transcriptional antiterminator Rof (Rho-off)
MSRGARPLTNLREDYFPGERPHQVDRGQGCIYGCKLVGRFSSNTHGVRGAASTEYTLEALRQAAPLYENVPVSIDHPDRTRPQLERSARDRFGKVTNVQVREDGLYGDLWFLKAHPMAELVAEAAERMPEAFALSHNALGRGEVRNGVYTITEIPTVKGVDVVADGGTNISLFESIRTEIVKLKLKSLLESGSKLHAKARPFLTKLVEMGYGEVEMEAEPADVETDHAAAVKHAFHSAYQAIHEDDEMETEEKIKKLRELMKAHDKYKEGTAAAEEGERDDDDEPDIEGPETTESHKPTKSKDPAVRQLQEELATLRLEKNVRSLCESKGVECDATLLETLMAIGDQKKIAKHLDYLKGLSGSKSKGRSAPKSQSQTAPLTESRYGVPEKPEDQLAWLRS